MRTSDMKTIDETPSGEALRDNALDLLRQHRAALVRECTVAALRIALREGEVTADDVRAVVPIPPGINPKLVGAAFNDLADGILRRSGDRPSKRKLAHARRVTVWELGDRATAAAQLATLTRPTN